MRRRATAEEVDAQAAEARRLFLAGHYPKEVADKVGVTSTNIYRVLKRSGMVKMYLTQEEAREVRAARAMWPRRKAA
jgi:DNA invertase Pin-like site-specific DNA recombinase